MAPSGWVVPSAAVGAHGFGPPVRHVAANLELSFAGGSPSRRRAGVAASLAFLALVVVAFTGGWSRGRPTLDGPGISLWVRLLLDHWRSGNGIPSWIPEMWSGTPAWDLFPAFHLLVLLPIAAVVGPDEAVKLGILAAQIAGAWGAFVLARSLWDRAFPAVAAGVLYGLHPLFASHGALTGLEPTVWVFAATPWLVWSLRRALRRQGSRYIALAGLLVGFAVLQQAEQAYSLVLLCGLLVVLEVARARHSGRGATGPGGVLVRAGAVVCIGLGTVAHWLLPFSAASKSFVLTPADEVGRVLEALSGSLSREPGTFLDRAEGLAGTYDFFQLSEGFESWRGAAGSAYYLSLVCVVLTGLTVVLLSRRTEGEGTLSAILLASMLGIWLSMGPVSLASGGLAYRDRVVALAAIGVLAGLLVGTFLRRLELGRASLPVGIAAAVLLFAVPYLTPVFSAQGVVPFLASIRVHRFYNLAALGVAMGAAYPLTQAQRWAALRRPEWAPLFGAALCLLLIGAFLLDVRPYATYYRLRPPDGAAAYGRMSGLLAGAAGDFRLASESHGNPQTVQALVGTGRPLSVGWPHPLASKSLWRLTAEVLHERAPKGFRDRALGLSASGLLATEQVSTGAEPRTVEDVDLTPNPWALPVVRAYERAVVVEDGDLTPELAVALSGRNVGLVQGGSDAVRALGGAAAGMVGGPRPCEDERPSEDERLRAEVAMACAMHRWVGVRFGVSVVAIGAGVGDAFTAAVDGLRGVAVWLDRAPRGAELVLHEQLPDGVSPGREVARANEVDVDVNGMARFSFPPIAQSAGRRFVFSLSCPRCAPGEEPRMAVTSEPRRTDGRLVEGRLPRPGAAAFSPVYEALPAAPRPGTTVRPTRSGPGRWQIEASGTQPVLLVVAESYFPGWRATVDGRRVEVVQADGAFLGVPVPAGRHDVTLSYHRSSMVPIGRAVTVITLLLCVPLLLGARLLSRRRPAPVVS